MILHWNIGPKTSSKQRCRGAQGSKMSLRPSCEWRVSGPGGPARGIERSRTGLGWSHTPMGQGPGEFLLIPQCLCNRVPLLVQMGCSNLLPLMSRKVLTTHFLMICGIWIFMSTMVWQKSGFGHSTILGRDTGDGLSGIGTWWAHRSFSSWLWCWGIQ